MSYKCHTNVVKRQQPTNHAKQEKSTWIKINHSHVQHSDVHDLLNGLIIDGVVFSKC